MNIILFGPPGAGKGTQANILVKHFKMHKISTGDLLRDEINKNTSLGKKIKSEIDKGKLVSDDIIDDLLKEILSNEKLNNRLIFDGYPRNLSQAEKLDLLIEKNNRKIACVLSLKVDMKSIVQRILGRQTCSNCGLIFNEYYSPSNKENHSCDAKFLIKRSDDNEKIIKERFKTYEEATLPILNFYGKQKILHEVNGMAEIDAIYKEIQGIITSIET